jgi:uncharacterized protein
VIERVVATPQAAALVDKLIGLHGALMFHLSGGCCDGSSPMCYPAGAFKVGAVDVLLGSLRGCDFWMWADQYQFFAASQLIIDTVPGRGGGFSLEAPEGMRFLLRSRIFTDEELAQLEQQAPPPRGDNRTPHEHSV